MKVLCISASNILHSKENSTSQILCSKISEILREKEIGCETVDLRDYLLRPCIGCGKCFESKRCCNDTDFNLIYEKVIEADALFFVSPHYAPIPAKLSMLLEKMEEITFLHWWKDNEYKSEVYGVPTGIISHGGAPDWALKSYKAMVNDTIANALDTIQCKIIPYNSEWDTGISLPVERVLEEDSIFPIQKYDWNLITQKLRDYIELVLKNYWKGVRMSSIYKIREFRAEDASEVAALIAKTLRTVNIKDYSEEYIEANVSSHSSDVLIERAKQGHMYVVYDDLRIVGCGAIAGYWGSTTESILLTIFVLPEYQGKGIGTLMIRTLEQDEFFLRAKRIEIPASITAVGFYQKMGYDYKNGIAEIDDEQVYRLEKFR